MGETGLTLLAIYSGDLQELNIKKKKGKTLGAVTQNDCQNQLLELAKESERISKQLDEAMQTFVQENGNINKEYIDQLIELGENGALIAGALCFCYGEPVCAESGIVAHEAYGQIAISCMYWKAKKEYSNLAQPIFERGIVQLIRAKYDKNLWDEENEPVKFQKIKKYLNMVPKPIMCQAIEGMKNSWLEEARILGGLIGILNKSNI